MKKLKILLSKTKWHLLAAVFTFAFTLCGNIYNIMSLATTYVEQIPGTQYGFQLAICTVGSFMAGHLVEIVEGFMGANRTEKEIKEEATPDIIVTTLAGFLGSFLAIVYYINFY